MRSIRFAVTALTFCSAFLARPLVLEAQEPLEVPGEFSYLGKTRFRIEGPFATGSTLSVNGVLVRDATIGRLGEITGTMPAYGGRDRLPVSVDVVVTPPRGLPTTLRDAVTYVGPLSIDLVTSTTACAGGPVTIRGNGFTPQTRVRIGGVEVDPSNVTFLGVHSLRATAPPLGVGVHDVEVSDTHGGTGAEASDLLPDGVLYNSSVALLGVEPNIVPTAGGTLVTITGQDFRDGFVFRVDGQPLQGQQIIDARTARGRTNALPAGRYTLDVIDRSNCLHAALEGAIEFEEPPAPTIVSVTPDRVSTEGGELVSVRGRNFSEDMLLTLHNVGQVSLEFAFVGAELVRFLTPPHPEGAVDLSVRRAVGAPASFLREALTYVEPTPDAPVVTSFTPAHVDARGGEEIVVRGENFAESLEVLLVDAGGAVPVMTPMEFDLTSDSTLTAIAPAAMPGLYNIGVRIGRDGELALSRDLLELVDPAAPGPEQIEATLIDGVVEMDWINPIPYEQVLIYRDDVLHATLDGNVQHFLDPEEVRGTQAGYRLVGIPAALGCAISDVLVTIPLCDNEVSFGTADRGEKDFRIWGGHSSFHDRDPQNPKEPPPDSLTVYPNDSSYQLVEVSADTGRATMNYDYPVFLAVNPKLLGFTNELVSGFTLTAPAEKLTVGIHGTKIADAPDLTLRVLIESVTPNVNRFVELTARRQVINPDHDWIELAYNTNNPPAPGSPFPDPEDPAPPEDPLPAGDYIVRVYAVGGEAVTAHFSVSSDFSSDQIPIPGVGCPPYPLIRVERGGRSDPEITDIRQLGEPENWWNYFDPQEQIFKPVLTAQLEALVTDIDGDPIHSYEWTLPDGLGGAVNKFSTSNKTQMTVVGYGTYLVTLTVKDNNCGQQTKLVPVTIRPPCRPAGPGPNFTYPTPRPRQLYYLTNLSTIDSLSTEPNGRFRIFVVDDIDPALCDSALARTTQVQVGLFPESTSGNSVGANQALQLVGGGPAIVDARLQGFYTEGTFVGQECEVATITDPDDGLGLDEDGLPCTFDTSAGRFWVAELDMTRLPEVPGDAKLDGRYQLRARGFYTNPGQQNGQWTSFKLVRDYDGQTGPAISGSGLLNVFDKPKYFDTAGYSALEYVPQTQQYFFTISMAEPGTGGPIATSEEVELEHPDLGVGELPSADFGVTSLEQTAFVNFEPPGVWSLDKIRRGYEAFVLGKRVYDSTTTPGTSTAKGLADDLLQDLEQHLCDNNQLVNESFEIPIFDAPVFVDPFTGGVILKVSFSAAVGGFVIVGLGYQLDLEPLEDPAYLAQFYLDVLGGVYLSAAIRADILLGFVSGSAGMDLGATINAPFLFRLPDPGVPEFAVQVNLVVDFWVEGCVAWLFCKEKRWNLVDDPILDFSTGRPVGEIQQDILANKFCAGGKSIELDPGLAKGIPPNLLQLNAPQRQLTIASSPDGNSAIAVGRDEDRKLFFITRSASADWTWPPEEFIPPTVEQQAEYVGAQSDPQVAFLDNDHVILAWTQDFSNEDPELADIDEEDLGTLETYNKVTRRSEIVYTIGTLTRPTPNPDIIFVNWSEIVRVTNDPAPNGLRADGRVSVAADPNTGDAWLSWVRYEVPDLVAPGPDGPDGPSGNVAQLQHTSVYAQRLDLGLPGLEPTVKISGDANDIDIQPDIAIGPDGTVMIVWLHDAVNDDLMSSNIGRELLYSVYQGNDTWSAPAAVLNEPSAYKAMLEPDLALGLGGGMLAFTAGPENLAEDDIALGSTRLLYTVQLTHDGSTFQWGEPTLVGEQCDTPIFVHDPTVQSLAGKLGHFALFAQQLGSFGSREGAGNALAMTYSPATGRWSDPVNLTPDDRMHQDVSAVMSSAGEIVMLHQSPFPAQREAAVEEARRKALRRQKGLPDEPEPIRGGQLFGELMGQSFAAVADPAITACRIGNNYAAPGARVTATVDVRNNGFDDTPNDRGASRLFLRIFHEIDGERGPVRELVEEVAVPVLAPGEETTVEIELTMPRQPVRLRAEVDEVEGEFDLSDNVRLCPLGAQPPTSLQCRLMGLGDQDLVDLRWENGGLYDRIIVYRDGESIAQLDGGATHYVDANVGFNLRSRSEVESHEYCVRGCIRDSRSVKSELCTVDLTPEVGLRFLRGDCDGDGDNGGVTDAIFQLTHNFLGGVRIRCQAACDANGDGDTSGVTDAIVLLTFNFLGGVELPPPMAACGVSNRENDLRLGCEIPPDCAR